MASAVDITARVKAQRDLANSTRLLNAIAEQTDDLLFVKDRAGRMVMANRAMLQALRKDASEVIGRTDEEFNGSGYLDLELDIGQGGGGQEAANALLVHRGDLIVFATAEGDTVQFGGPNEFAALRIRNDRQFRDGFEAND